ncbi:MAG TPA: DUF4394 domain-containing protein [Thermoleophilaceae bacterium]|nr:DUF4394 domain-containing protein [Thermoleophilaceae bacterium]
MNLGSSRIVLALLAVAVIGASAPGSASAVPAAGITGVATLVTFDTAAPGDLRVRPITGLQSSVESVIGIDTRPATGELFVVTVPTSVQANALVRTYKLDPVTSAATFVGSIPGTVPDAGDQPGGMDFQPLVDRIRLVGANNENFRVNPNNGGLSGNDPDLTYMAPATGPVTAEAYDRNVAFGPPGTVAPPGSQTTLYGIDVGSDRLVIQGGLNGPPPGPNSGSITAVGLLGVTVVNTSDAGFDIAPNGTAYASLRSAAGSSLYTVDLNTGAATAIGALAAELRSLTVLAADNCPLVSGDDQADLDGDGQGDACDDDIDGDGVSNATEQARGTDPRNADSDGDGLADGPDACPTLAGPSPSGCPRRALDVTRPTIKLRGPASRLTRKRFFAGIASRISVGERASLDVVLLGRARSAHVARAGDVVLAERHLGRSRRTRTVRLKPARRLVGTKKRFSVRLRVTATDAAGNHRTAIKTVRVRG